MSALWTHFLFPAIFLLIILKELCSQDKVPVMHKLHSLPEVLGVLNNTVIKLLDWLSCERRECLNGCALPSQTVAFVHLSPSFLNQERPELTCVRGVGKARQHESHFVGVWVGTRHLIIYLLDAWVAIPVHVYFVLSVLRMAIAYQTLQELCILSNGGKARQEVHVTKFALFNGKLVLRFLTVLEDAEMLAI